MSEQDCPYVSRGGLKLAHALRAFSIDPTGMVCADLGCSTGGFTDCLLRHGAARVYAVDTGYGQLAWSLRKDPRVVVMERSNALHTPPPSELVRERGGVDLVVIDLGWTRQRHAVPAAFAWLAPGGRIVTLVKPHYERDGTGQRGAPTVLEESEALAIVERIRGEMPSLGGSVLGIERSPILGGSVGASARSKGRGNAEWLMLVGRMTE